jgi:hypothetical protein
MKRMGRKNREYYRICATDRRNPRDGRVIESREVVTVRGGPEAPLSREELWAKFEDCARAGDSRLDARALFDALTSLERVLRVGDLPGLTQRNPGLAVVAA